MGFQVCVGINFQKYLEHVLLLIKNLMKNLLKKGSRVEQSLTKD